jgi:3,4-dihydroxy-2-butanone 4-phosphate synthase
VSAPIQSAEPPSASARVAAVAEDLRAGRMVLLSGGVGREDEASLVLAAEFTSAEAINFMAKEARGLICLALTAERCDELGLEPISRPGGGDAESGFMVSIESREGVTTGISAHDRSRTIRTAVDPSQGPMDLVQPGHVMPLRARPGGIFERAGQAEAAVDLARLAGIEPAAIVCTVLDEDGATATGAGLLAYAQRHDLNTVSVDDLLAHRRSAALFGGTMREAMGHFATGVSVVTARDGDGETVGTTVNAVSSVSLQPPLLLVCLARDSHTLAAIRQSSRFAINVLAADQHHHSNRFAAKGEEARAGEVPFVEHPSGVPHLPGSLATISCRLDAIHVAGDHEIVIGEALSISTEPEASPLLFYRGSYASLGGDHEVELRAVS